jgi:hypothetical protein
MNSSKYKRIPFEAGRFSDIGEPDQDNFIERHQAALEWLHETATGMVDYTDSVYVAVEAGDVKSSYILHVAPEDVGKMIGRQGSNARALRAIFYAIGRRMGCRFELDIVEVDPETRALHNGIHP